MKNSTWTEYGARKLHKESTERAKELGLKRADTVNAFSNFLINSEESEVYEFMRKWHIKKPLLFIAGVLAGYFLSGLGSKAIQWASVSLEAIDKVMK